MLTLLKSLPLMLAMISSIYAYLQLFFYAKRANNGKNSPFLVGSRL